MDCKYAEYTSRQWVKDRTNCVVVKCSHKYALEDVKNKKWNYFAGLDGTRFPVGDNMIPLPTESHIERRSCMCNESCPYYEAIEE